MKLSIFLSRLAARILQATHCDKVKNDNDGSQCLIMTIRPWPSSKHYNGSCCWVIKSSRLDHLHWPSSLLLIDDHNSIDHGWIASSDFILDPSHHNGYWSLLATISKFSILSIINNLFAAWCGWQHVKTYPSAVQLGNKNHHPWFWIHKASAQDAEEQTLPVAVLKVSKNEPSNGRKRQQKGTP